MFPGIGRILYLSTSTIDTLASMHVEQKTSYLSLMRAHNTEGEKFFLFITAISKWLNSLCVLNTEIGISNHIFNKICHNLLKTWPRASSLSQSTSQATLDFLYRCLGKSPSSAHTGCTNPELLQLFRRSVLS